MRTTLLGAAATAVVLIFGLTAPATAESVGRHDPAETGHGVDLRAVHVAYREHNLRITLNHTNLRRNPATGSSGIVYLDTDPADRGPEFAFTGGYFDGTDYDLVATEGFGVRNWRESVKGSYELTLRYRKDQTKMRISRRTLGGADDVRVAVKVAGRRTDGSTVTDWLRKPRSYTLWVARD